MTLITLGPEGTFSHEMACRIDSGDIILVPTITSVFSEVIRTNISGIVPLENSEAGGVTTTLDCLTQFPVTITLESYLSIHHCLASFNPEKTITKVYAHPQSHEQCSRLIENLGLSVIHTESNAASALAMKADSGSAAIISENLANRHKIPVLLKNIENNTCNITRFIRISSLEQQITNPEKCSLLIDPGENRSGLLYDLLTPFKREDVNLTRIESRPSKRSMGRYVFFLDFQCEAGWKNAVNDLMAITTVKHLGCYSQWSDE